MPNGSLYIPSQATAPRNEIFPTYFMQVDQPAIPRLQPFRFGALPYSFDVPNGPGLGYTKEQLGHGIRMIASVSHLPYTPSFPHSAALHAEVPHDAGSSHDVVLTSRQALTTRSTDPQGRSVLGSFTPIDQVGPSLKFVLISFRESSVVGVMPKGSWPPILSWLETVTLVKLKGVLYPPPSSKSRLELS